MYVICCLVLNHFHVWSIMSIILIYVMSRVRPSGRPAWQKLQCSTLRANCSTTFCQTCHAFRHHWFILVYATFTDFDLAWGSQDQLDAKPIGFIFSHAFHRVRMKFDQCNEAVKLNIPRLLLKRFFRLKEITAVLPTMSKKGMYSKIYQSMWFKLRTIVLYILIQVLFILTLIQGHRSARKQKLRQLFHKAFARREFNLVYCWDLLVWWIS